MVIVNDMSEVNIDADLVRDAAAALARNEESLVEMTNGCICCTLRDDLLQEVCALAEAGKFDRLEIERAGALLRSGLGDEGCDDVRLFQSGQILVNFQARKRRFAIAGEKSAMTIMLIFYEETH